jgi:hypothetical protein
MKSILFKAFEKYFFYAVLLTLFFLYEYGKILNDYPTSIHEWRQSDAWSMTLNYYRESLGLFDPKIHLQYSIDGKAVGEFPIIYYLNAMVWKVTGPTPITLRIVTLIFVFWGLNALYKLSKSLLKSSFQASLIPLFVFASPIFVFYANNFLVNIVALSLVFVSWYYTYKLCFLQYKTRTLLLVICVLSFALLLRPTMILGYLPLLYPLVLSLKTKSQQIKIRDLLLIVFVPIGLGLAWILYMKNYNSTHHSIYFLSTIRPIWDANNTAGIWMEFTLNIWRQFIYQPVFYLLLIGFVVALFKKNAKSGHWFLFVFLGMLVLFSVYFIAWYQNFNVHDYYFLEFYLVYPLFLFFLLWQLKQWYVNTALFLAFVVMVLYSLTFQRNKYHKLDNELSSLFLTKKEMAFYDWMQWNSSLKKGLLTVQPLLRDKKITRDEKVLCLFDPSSNLSLSLMDQKGYTAIYLDVNQLEKEMQFFKSKGVRYIVMVDNLSDYSQLNPYLGQEILSHQGIHVYRIE